MYWKQSLSGNHLSNTTICIKCMLRVLLLNCWWYISFYAMMQSVLYRGYDNAVLYICSAACCPVYQDWYQEWWASGLGVLLTFLPRGPVAQWVFLYKLPLFSLRSGWVLFVYFAWLPHEPGKNWATTCPLPRTTCDNGQVHTAATKMVLAGQYSFATVGEFWTLPSFLHLAFAVMKSEALFGFPACSMEWGQKALSEEKQVWVPLVKVTQVW